MPAYMYTAVDKSGKEIKGTIDAENIDLARQEAKNKDLTLLSLKEQTLLNADISFDIGGKPKARDLGVMCRQFVAMNRAGVTMIESLKMLSEQTENKKLKATLHEVRLNVERGESLAVSMAAHPNIFPEIMINMITAGEASGNLDIALERVSVQLENSARTTAMVKKAMIYPIAVLIVAIVVSIVMLVVVLPNYAAMFEDLGTEAIRRLEVENMPLIVAIDAFGGNLYEEGPAAYKLHSTI